MTSQTVVIHRLTYKGIEGPGQNQHRPTLPETFDGGAAVRVHDKLARLRTAVQHCLIDVKGADVSMVLVTTSHGLTGDGVILAGGELKVSFFDRELAADRQTLEELSDAEYVERWQGFYDRGERMPSRTQMIVQKESALQATRSDYVFTVDSLSVTGRQSPAESTTGRSATTSTNDPSLALLKELASLLGEIAQLLYNSPPSFLT
ncbi:hypothetical protein ABIA30_003002 [Mycobacterium sp. MAA66]|uniref:hypothetical protein n=1 Tax=Mycobacterium sp. MAA66 TaxID=3156297 RepID=UPI0035143A20